MKKIFIFILIILEIILVGCSSKSITIAKAPNCRVSSNPIFVIHILKDKNLENNGYVILPKKDMFKIVNNTNNSINRYFPKSNIYFNTNVNGVIYRVFIGGEYKTYTYNDVTPITTFHSPQYFNGFTSKGTYYYGSTGGSSSTTWVPTTSTGINIWNGITVLDPNSNIILRCNMFTHDINDLNSKDWIDDCLKKLTTCQKWN